MRCALQFDGSNDYVTFGAAPGLGASNFTLEVWFKRTGTGVTTTSGTGGVTDAIPLLTKGRGEGDGSNVDMNFFLGISTSNNVLAADFEEAAGSDSGLNHPVFGVTPITNQGWYHAAVTYDGSKWQLFLNGNLERELVVGRLPRWDSIQHAALGSALTSTGVAAGYFQGILDEARVWNFARSAAQIAQSRNTRITSATGLIGRWPLDELTGSTARDTSGNNINGTLKNGPTWVTGYPFDNPPSVTITNPVAGTTLIGPTNVLVEASAADLDGTVTNVTFRAGTNTLGSDTASPFSLTWSNAPVGAHTVTAIATDNMGLSSTSAPVSITIQDGSVRLIAPTNGTRVVIPDAVTLAAEVADTTNGPMALVEFFSGATKLGEVSSAPFSVVWSGTAAGSYSVFAVGTDGSGIHYTSLVASVVIAANTPPSVGITSPTNGEVLVLPSSIAIQANATDVEGTVTNVEFYQGETRLGEDGSAPFTFTWSSPPLGTHSLRAVATDERGAMATSAVVNITVASASVTRSPYLQSATTNGITIRWRTSAPTDTRVWCGLAPEALSFVTSDSVLTNEHVLTLTGLLPDTRYFYAIGTSLGPVMNDTNLWFTTLPVPGTDKPTRIWVLSDVGYGGTTAASVRNAYTNFTGARGTDVVLTMGDNEQHNGTDAQFQTYFFDVWSAQLRNLVFWTTLGNHDTWSSSTPGPYPYFDIFSLPSDGRSGGVPSGTENYYSFDHGQVHFLSIDSVAASHATNSAMANWIRADLLLNTKPWVIAYWHYPPYSMGSHNSDTEAGMKEMRENIVPILEAGGVDLVLCGHTHVYERTHLINGHYGLSSTLTPQMKKDGGDGRTNGTGAYLKPPGRNGAVYVVAAVTSQAGGFVGIHPAMYYRLGSTLGSSVLDVSCDRLDYRFLDNGGIVRDYFTILKGNSQSAPPDVPSSFMATVITSNKVALSWANNATNEASYSLERSLDGVNFELLATVGANLTTFTNTSLNLSTAYFYRLRAWNNAGFSDFTPVRQVVTPALSVPPTVAIASPANGAAFVLPANLTFTASASDIDGSVTNVEFLLNGVRVGEDASSPYTFSTSGLQPAAWTLAAVAWDNAGIGNTSAPVTFTVASAAITRGPYVQLITTNSAVVRWRTATASDSVVRFGPSAGNLSLSVTDLTSTAEHVVQVSNLPPDTAWFYSVGTTGGPATFDTNCFFVTAPMTGSAKPVRIWALGDPGTKDVYQRQTRDGYLGFVASRRADLILTLGDTDQDNATDAEYQQSIFDMYPALLRNTPLWPAIGNHDTYTSNALPYLNAFSLPTNGVAGGVPSGTELYYSFDFANIHFICLESQLSDRATNGPMLTWLRQDLAANRQPWTIAYWHHPPYSKGDHDSDTDSRQIQMRQNAAPILEAAGVDLVLNGHCHVYERSFLLNGHYGLSSTFNVTNKLDGGDGRTNGTGAYLKPAAVAGNQGTVYVEAGVSGEVVTLGTLNHPAVLVGQRTYGSLVIDVESNRLDCRFVNTNAGVADHFTIIKGQSVPPAAPASLAAGLLTSSSAWVSWENTPTNEMAFKVERSTNGIDFVQVAVVGANLTAFTNTGLASSTPYFYRVRASNDAGDSAGSPVAGVSTPGPPRIALQPQSVTNLAGATVVFSVVAGGTTPLSYQWWRSGAPMPGQTGATLTLAGVQSADAGSYSVIVSNSAGTLTSAIASLTVNHAPVPASLVVERLPFSGVKLRRSAVLGTDEDGDPISLASVGPGTTQGGTVLTNVNWILYRPPGGFTNADSFSFTVADGRGGMGTGVITVNVTHDTSAMPGTRSKDLGSGSVELHFSGIPLRSYAVQFCESLVVPDWQTLVQAQADAFGSLRFVDTPPAGSSPRHYRISPTQF